jgi:hypothetical protein
MTEATSAPARLSLFERLGSTTIARLSRVRIAIWLFVFLVIGAIVLNFLPMSTVEFSIYAETEGLNFRTAETMLVKPTKLQGADVLSAESLTIDEQPLSLPSGGRISIAAADGDLTLSEITVPKDWAVSIQGTDRQHLSVNANPSPKAAANGRAVVSFIAGSQARLTYPGQNGETVTSDLPENGEISLSTKTLSIELNVNSAKILNWAKVTDIALVRDSKAIDSSGHETIDVDGTVVSGKLWREYSANAMELGPLDQVSAKSLSGGILKNVVWKDGLLSVAAHGNAGELRDQIGDASRDLRPVLLDVLRELGLLQVILGIFTFLGGLELTALFRARR